MDPDKTITETISRGHGDAISQQNRVTALDKAFDDDNVYPNKKGFLNRPPVGTTIFATDGNDHRLEDPRLAQLQ
jgi:hypothetical protein